VVSYHADHGVELNTRKHWTLRWCVTDETTDFEENPVRLTVTIPLDGEELAVTLDGDLQVLDTERRCRNAGEDGAHTTPD